MAIARPKVGEYGEGVHSAAIEKIEGFAKLQPGWDGHRAPAIVEPACRLAIAFLALLRSEYGPSVRTPLVVPTLDGGIAFEWRSKFPDGEREVELVFKKDSVEYSVGLRDGDTLALEGSTLDFGYLSHDIIKPHVLAH
jgi:hypothetical protein